MEIFEICLLCFNLSLSLSLLFYFKKLIKYLDH